MAFTDWSARLSTIGATPNELSAISAAYYASTGLEQSALDTLVAALANPQLLIMLNTWRSNPGPFQQGFPGGGLPFGTGVAVLTGNPGDDALAVSAGTGQKITVDNAAGLAAVFAPIALPTFVGPVSINGSAPKVTAGPAGGTSPPLSLTSGSDDTSGTIIVTPGAGADNSDDLVTVTFSTPLAAGVLPQVLVRGADLCTAMFDLATQHESQFGFGIAIAGMPAVGLAGLTLSIKYLMIASS